MQSNISSFLPSPIKLCAKTSSGSTSLQNAVLSAVNEGRAITGTALCKSERYFSSISGQLAFISTFSSSLSGLLLKKPFISSPTICSQSAQLPPLPHISSLFPFLKAVISAFSAFIISSLLFQGKGIFLTIHLTYLSPTIMLRLLPHNLRFFRPRQRVLFCST